MLGVYWNIDVLVHCDANVMIHLQRYDMYELLINTIINFKRYTALLFE